MTNTQDFIRDIKNRAKTNPQSIVFPEADIDSRILEASYLVAKEKIACPILLGNKESLKNKLKKFNSNIPKQIKIIDHSQSSPEKDRYIQRLYELRKDKGLSLTEAKSLLNDINYFGTLMVEQNQANGMISGSTYPTSDTIRPALQILKLKDKFHRASSFFFMILEEKTYLFADCAINIQPSAEDLKNIALDTAETALKFKLEPKISFLAFSTQGSATHPSLDRIIKATKLTQKAKPNLLIEGEVQVDTAINQAVAKRKYPNSKIKGDSNILIFPDLNSANISYKLVERLAKAKAIGPIMQGLSKPINDLSRGCSVEDIINLSAITCLQAQDLNYNNS